MTTTFKGYDRGDGRIGIRNHVVALSTVTCANHVAEKIALKTDVIGITHNAGCLQVGEDFELTKRTIRGMALNPNVGAVLFVGLGCEQVRIKEMVAAVTDKPCEYVVIQESGGTRRAIEDGISKIEKLKESVP